MARLRRKGLVLEKTQDPGKDLFAYLFLLMMVFSFMLLMTMEERYKGLIGTQGPESREPVPAKSTLASVEKKVLGQLVNQDGEVYIGFDGQLYHPSRGLEQLEEDGRIATSQNANGQGRKLLYLVQDNNNQILLTEYLSAFQSLSRNGITIAFAEVAR